MATPRVTVLMTVYNGEEYLACAIDSILDQTYGDFELLVVDDGSTDNTPHILANYRDTRIRVVVNQSNMGLTASLNRGLKKARGEWVARLDADDVASPERLAKQTAFLEKEPPVGAVVSWAQRIDSKGNALGCWDSLHLSEDFYYLLNFRNCITHSSIMFRRELVLTLGGYDNNVKRAQDYDLWFRLSKNTQIKQIPEILVSWRKTKAGISSQGKEDQDETVFKIVKKTMESLSRLKLTPQEVDSLQFNRPFDSVSLKRCAYLLDQVNRGLMKSEVSLREKLGLNSHKLKKLMATRKKNLLTAHLRLLRPAGRVRELVFLPFGQKIFLMGQLFQYIFGKHNNVS